MKRAEDIEKIATEYGFCKQKDILIEEMAELTQAISKYMRYKGTEQEQCRFKDVAEEIADVEIMLYQIKYLLGVSTDKNIDYKVDRQLERIPKNISCLR